ncbi:MAG: imidazolonepropionase [Cyclobacteriaceae bacterium]
MKQLIGPFKQLLTMDQVPLKGPIRDEELHVIEGGAVLIEFGLILEVGVFEAMAKKYAGEADIVKFSEELICLPGFIDSHTHICYSGTRARDFGLRNGGSSYLEIAENGGGIWDTVTQTRLANEHVLTQNVVSRANRHLSEGVTTIEVKSGYGLSVAEELKMLRSIQSADGLSYADLVSTCLAAHIKPKDFFGDNAGYLNHLVRELFPVIKQEKLTNRIDAFVEQGAFSAEEVRPYFDLAKAEGFALTVHADQFHASGSALAVEMGAVSADHLEASADKEIEILAKSHTVATALPGASIGLGCDFTPARKLLDAGACLAIASDWNPGSAPMGDLIMQASALATFQKLTNAEVLSAITNRAARALQLDDRGVLSKGMKADFVLYQTGHYNEILYHQGKLTPSEVWKDGKQVFKKD